MQPATPIVNKHIEFNGFDKMIENTINNETDLYTIQIGKYKNMDNLVIKIIPERTKNISFYLLNNTLYELQNTSELFNIYKTIDDLILKFKKLKYDVEEKNNELFFNLKMFSPDGEPKIISLTPEKKFEDHEKVINYLSNKINDLNATIKQKEQEINDLKMKNINQGNELLSLKSNILNYQKNEQVLNGQISSLNKENDLLKVKASSLTYEINNYKNRCIQLEGQRINENKLNELLQEKNRYNELLTKEKAKYSQLESNYMQLNDKYKELNKKYEILKKESQIDFKADASNILTSMNKLKFIIKYIKINEPSFHFNKIKLLYRGSRDGDRTKTCHELCDNKQDVLIIIQTDTGIVFGGYSKIGFKASNKATYLIDNNCFLFSVNFEKIFPAIENKKHISHISDICGLCFTGSLCFFDNFMKSYDNCIYETIQEYFKRLDDPYEMNGGKSKFKCKELEVYQFI